MRRTVSQIAASLGRAVKVAAAQTSDQASISWPKIAGQASTSGRSTTISWLSTTFASQARGVHRYSRNVRHLNFPPRHSMTRWGLGSNPSGNTVLWSLIAANGAVFLYWRVDPYAASKHFVVSLQSLRDGRLWTAITSAFSQHDGWHLAGNMVSLYFFGSDVGRLFGGRKLLLLYLAGGIGGSLAHVGWCYYNEKKQAWGRLYASRGALGASAAVNAIVVTDILLFPSRTVLLYGIIPMPAALLGLLWLWNDLGGTLSGGGGSSVAHAGHLGGAVTGLAFFLAFRRGRIKPSGW